MRVKQKREGKAGEEVGGGSRGRVEEERIKREGEVMTTGGMEIESLLKSRAIFLVVLAYLEVYFCYSTGFFSNQKCTENGFHRVNRIVWNKLVYANSSHLENL